MKSACLLLLLTAVATILVAEESKKTEITETFSEGAKRWKTTDPTAWKITEIEDGNKVYELIKKTSAYTPPHRSPLNIALLQDVQFSDFELRAKVKTTHESYGHRDLCFFFGFQDPAHFYYVHLGQETDDHANQIFIVNDSPRTKISSKTTPGTPWKDDTWHQVKIIRNAGNGSIRIFFDDMEEPVMEATDKTFLTGQVGMGSFDDTGMWDDIVVTGMSPTKTSED